MKDYSSEADARIVIDDLLRLAGWDPSDKSQVLTEVPLSRAPWTVRESASSYSGKPSRKMADGDEVPTGRADYVLLSARGLPLAVIEAKRSAIQPYAAKQQALPSEEAISDLDDVRQDFDDSVRVDGRQQLDFAVSALERSLSVWSPVEKNDLCDGWPPR